MNVTIHQKIDGLWGKLSIEDTSTAATILSDSSFKKWVLLALNQDGFVWTGELEEETMKEFTENGHLTFIGGNMYSFTPSGTTGTVPTDSWDKVATLYESWSMRDYSKILERLEAVHITDQTDNIFKYWATKYQDLQKIDHSKAKNKLLYDFSIVLVWWFRDNFRFEPGDTIVAGRKAHRLRFNNELTKERVLKAIVANNTETFPIHAGNMEFWNDHFSAGQIELKLEDVAAILQHRAETAQQNTAAIEDTQEKKDAWAGFVSGDGIPGRRIRDLTDTEAKEIKAKIAAGTQYQEIEQEYGMRSGTITKDFGKHWKMFLYAYVNNKL